MRDVMVRYLLSLVVFFAVPAAAWADFSIGPDGPQGAKQSAAENPVGAKTQPELTDGAGDASVVVRAVTAPAESWIVSPADATLRHVLAKWTARAGWQLLWEASVDVPVTVSASFDGDFRSAVKRLFSSLSAAEVNLTGLMYTGNRVLRVTESGRRAQ